MRWKWVLTAATGIFIVLIVATYVVLISYDFNKIKPQITKFVKDTTGRRLALGGDLVLDIDFTPSLSVENVTFENAPWGSRFELAKIKQLKVEVALLPLIRGNIDVKQLIQCLKERRYDPAADEETQRRIERRSPSVSTLTERQFDALVARLREELR